MMTVRPAPITVCGLGPGGLGDITGDTLALLQGQRPVFLRTRRHPSAVLAPSAESFDAIYDAGADLDGVYRQIADHLITAAQRYGTVNGDSSTASRDIRLADGHDHRSETGPKSGAEGGIVYAVPGSPLVLERSVRYLREDPRAAVTMLPALSFLDTAWARLGIDPVEAGVRLIDGHTFATDAAGERGPLLVAHAHAQWVLSDIKLAIDAGADQKVIVLQRLGTPEEHIIEVEWPDLDRVVDPDHLTSLYLPELTAPVAQELHRSVELMHQLRQECPWDAEQTHGSLRRYLLEETHEVLEVLDELVAAGADADLGVEYGNDLGDSTDPDSAGSHRTDGGDTGDDLMANEDRLDRAYVDLEEELGDLWFQILFQAEIAAEAGRFSIADVARSVHDKLVQRHPHVFGSVDAPDAAAVERNWESIKKQEKQRNSILDGIPAGLPALVQADKTLVRVARAEAPISAAWVESMLDAGTGAAWDAQQIGHYVLALAEQARQRGVDLEAELRQALAEIRGRFQQHEAAGTLSERWVLG